MTHQRKDIDRLLKAKDIVKPHGILPICRSTLWNLVRKGVLGPGIRLGRTRCWRMSEITALIARLEANGGKDG